MIFVPEFSWRYWGGGDMDLPPVEESPPPTVRVYPEVEKAKSDLREKMKRRKGRVASRLTGIGLWQNEPETKRPVLAERLGKGPL
jgi:hypothetical protein